jgi:hypothetical protein
MGEEIIRASALILKEAHFTKIVSSGVISIDGLNYRRGKNQMQTTKLVSNDVKYEPAWLSYLASVTGVMKYYGKNVTIEKVGGYSGYSFLLNMAEVFICPSGPTAHPLEIWEEVHNGTNPLGVTIHQWSENESFPETEFAISSRDQQRSKILFEKVKSAIDTSNRPVIIWGIPVPEYGIVKGYENNTYIVSTFRYLNRLPDNPIKYDALQSPGCLEMLTLEPNTEQETEETMFTALKRALKFAKGSFTPVKGYKVGPKALDQWIDHLEHEDDKRRPYHGNSYLGVCTGESFQLSSKFLATLSNILKNEKLSKASEFYAKAANSIESLVKIFPFGFEGILEIEKRKKSVKNIKDAKNSLENAIELLNQSI